MVRRDRPSASLRSKPALNAPALPVSTTTEVLAVVLEAARSVGELAQRLGRQGVDTVTAVEPHHGDAPLRPEALFNGHKPRQDAFSLPAISDDDSGEGSQRPCRFVKSGDLDSRGSCDYSRRP